jgi:hypothetical protein
VPIGGKDVAGTNQWDMPGDTKNGVATLGR